MPQFATNMDIPTQQDPTTSKKIVPHRILTTAWEGRDDMKQINENLWPICIHLLCMKNRRTEEIHDWDDTTMFWPFGLRWGVGHGFQTCAFSDGSCEGWPVFSWSFLKMEIDILMLEMVKSWVMNFEHDVIPNILAFWSLNQMYSEWPTSTSGVSRKLVIENIGSIPRSSILCDLKLCSSISVFCSFRSVCALWKKEDDEDLFFLSTARIGFSD